MRELRDRPMPVLEYKMGESSGVAARKIDRLRAARASHIEGRLHGMERHAEIDFALAKDKGRARQDFDRSR